MTEPATTKMGTHRHADPPRVGSEGAEARRLIAELGPGFNARTVRVLTEGDLVAVHGVHDDGGHARAGFDVFRIDRGRLAEHWAAHQAVVATTASGNSQTDGPADVTRPQQGARNGRLVDYLIDTILIGRKHDRLKHFFVADLIQHDPLVGNGVKALTAAWRTPGTGYERRHTTIADGEFVLTVSTGTVRHAPRVFYDLFRVDRGMVVEHWNVTTERGGLPSSTPVAITAPESQGS
ncbi:hypothetical protein ACFQY4_12995 [Catellatospora bangladeshensis]|uniref:Polyketide cyclase n=1 Tax=Catellatospora bangladeshensis TaxID=310355 RepID=A0A8J3NPM8_9ACTN|nr:hypothetical protein [Catellatospora bangladeshensis]GIF86120.1 polyketide cyclase [Catellatospora bangladeshensis]